MFTWLLRLLRSIFGREQRADEVEGQTHHASAAMYSPTTNAALHRDEEEDDDSPPRYAYALRDDFLSPAEASFFRVLRLAVADELLIFPKVRLADLVYAPKQDAQYGAWQKINRKHVDFVLCAAETLRPRLVIELDDRSHRRSDRIERDAFVDGIFAGVGLPILRVPAARSYATAQLAASIQAALGSEVGAERRVREVEQPRIAPTDAMPRCARCGGEMRLRTATQGSNRGGQFWGCTNYPRCRNTVPVPIA